MNNVALALAHVPTTIARDEINVPGFGTVTVSTLWLPAPWLHHETAIFWGDADNFHVVATDPGTVSAIQSHLHYSCYPILCAFLHSV